MVWVSSYLKKCFHNDYGHDGGNIFTTDIFHDDVQSFLYTLKN